MRIRMIALKYKYYTAHKHTFGAELWCEKCSCGSSVKSDVTYRVTKNKGIMCSDCIKYLENNDASFAMGLEATDKNSLKARNERENIEI